MKIEPMLLTEVDDTTILNDTTRIFQEKHNGVRAIIHVKDHKIVGIRGRSNNPLLFCFPEFKDVTFNINKGILDGEICVFYDGKSIFYGGVDRRRSVPSPKTLRDYPATIVVFDAIQIEDEVLVHKPYKDRLAAIQNLEFNHGQLYNKLIEVVNSSNDGKALWDWIVSENREGVVVKDPMGLYELGKRSKQFLKLKNYKYVDVVVEKTEPNAKGTKIYAHVVIDGTEIAVECQRAGAFNINVGDNVRVKYLDIVGEKLIQPTNW